MANVYTKMSCPHDECYTTSAESEKLVLFLEKNNSINKNMIIWLPFDTERSNIYKSLHDKGYTTLLSSLEHGQDFYEYEPQKWDIIISNPPFSDRTSLLKRIITFDKPFIILQGTQFFNNKHAIKLLCNNIFKFIMPEDRMNFLTYHEKENQIMSSKHSCAFYSFWLCYKFPLTNVFNYINSSGKEKEIEKYDANGNVILDNQLNLFTLKGDE
jgi:hypothetical protein